MYKEIIEKEELVCTEIEFENFHNSIDLTDLETSLNNIVISKFTFDEKYNWVQIENIANWKYYYTAEIDWRVFLQNIVPFVSWNIALNDDNVDTVILEHKNKLIKDYIDWEKIMTTINYFKSI